MKAIFIPNNVYNDEEFEKLNKELKECYKINYYQKMKLNGMNVGTLLIVNNYTRKDKLKKLNNISNERTNNNSI